MSNPLRSHRSGLSTLKLPRILNDPRGPEAILPTLTAQELTHLIDALFRNLDTRSPEFDAETWYELAVQEEVRRSSHRHAARRSV